MDHTKENKDDGNKDHQFFIEDHWSSEAVEEINFFAMKRHKNSKQAAELSSESSPLLLLSFPIISGQTQRDTSSVSSEDLQEEEEDSDHQPIEEWMILGGEEQKEDSNIQLNLSYWNSSSDDEDMTDENLTSMTNIWAVSDKDKFGATQSSAARYFVLGRSSICYVCNKAGHFAKNCSSQKKCPTCVLCGVQGHIQRNCPGRPCPNCGLPSHGRGPCRAPPVWKQHCQRCGVTGHLTDACPDTWRQYHLTIKVAVPFRPKSVFSLKHKSHRAHCCNCSKRGHYGYECTKRRMISGTFTSLPYVSHYDTLQDFAGFSAAARGDKEFVSAGFLLSSDQKHLRETTADCGKKKGKSRKKDVGGRRKTWPERRRERREVKRLRREAQAKREGGLLGRSLFNSDDDFCLTKPFRHSLHGYGQFISPSEKKRRVEKNGKQSRKAREAERWRKRGGIKRGYLYPHPDMDLGSKSLLSPKQRVRHRRR